MDRSVCQEALPLNASVPPLTEVLPLDVLALLNVRVPTPVLFNANAPLITPPNVLLPPLPPTVNVLDAPVLLRVPEPDSLSAATSFPLALNAPAVSVRVPFTARLFARAIVIARVVDGQVIDCGRQTATRSLVGHARIG